MSLLCAIDDWVKWTTIFANLASCTVAISAIVAVVFFIKNRFGKQTFRASIFLTAVELTKRNVKAISFQLTFKNRTDKDVSVVGVAIRYEGKDYPVFKSSTDKNDIKPEDLLENLSIRPYQSATFGALFFGEKEIFSKKLPIKLIVETTRKKLVYKMNVDFNTASTNT